MGVNNSGFTHLGRPESTDWEEHSAVGDLSTGRRFKAVQNIPQKVIIDEVDANTTYYGYAQWGTNTDASLWRIMKQTVSGTITTLEMANGSDAFENIWDNRLSLNYS